MTAQNYALVKTSDGKSTLVRYQAPSPARFARSESRVLRLFGQLASRFVGLFKPSEPTVEIDFNLGPDWQLAHATGPTYDHLRAMSAFPAFPYPYAAVRRRAEDLSKLPITLTYDPGGEEPVEGRHPFYDIVRRPNSGRSWVQLHRQLVAYFTGTGNALIYVFKAPNGQPTGIMLLHPNRVEPVPNELGFPRAYRNTQTGEDYSPEDIVHIRDITWEDDPRALHGTSPFLCLDDTLTAEREIKRFTGRAAETGRPSAIISPGDPEKTWTDELAEQIAQEYAQNVKNGGALVNRHSATIQVLEVKPVDLQAVETRQTNREEVLAVLRTPPVMLGVPGQNRAESQFQAVQYWESLQGDAALFGDGWTTIANMFGGRPVYAHYSFAKVAALQRARSEQLERVKGWVELGATPLAAAAYEGLPDAPVKDEPLPSPFAPAASPPAADDGDAEVSEGGTERFDSWFERSLEVRAGLPLEEREERWSEWSKSLQEPFEQAIGARISRIFKSQVKAINEALAEIVPDDPEPTKGLEELEAIFDFEGAVAELTRAMLGLFDQALAMGFSRDAIALGTPDLMFDTRGEIAARLASDVSKRITETTAKAVKKIVDEGLDAGDTLAELRRKIRTAGAFSESRALTIARTESAHAVNVGQTEAQLRAAADGVDFVIYWLDSRDDATRPEHRKLGAGDPIEPGGSFTTSDGYSAPGPSQFGIPKHDINCRCTTYAKRRKRT